MLYDRNCLLIDSVRVDFHVLRLAWTPLDRVSPMMRDTLIASEDQRFRRHHGVDWLAIIGAVRDRIAGRRGRGASTLTMQLAGFLSPDLAAPGARGWLDKLRQTRAAWEIARHLSTEEIIEAFRNIADILGAALGENGKQSGRKGG